MKGIIVHRRPQVIKLATLLDFYQSEPQSQYKVCVQNGFLKTNISAKAKTNAYSTSKYINNQLQQQYANVRGMERVEKKSVGLFSNLIKQMDSSRYNTNEYQVEEQQMPKKRQYQFYFQQFKNQSEQSELKQLQGTSIKKIKQRATGFINVSSKRQNESKQNKKNEINQKDQHYQNYGKQPAVDINFSFEEISNHVEERKNTTTQKKTSQKYDIKITEVEPPLKKQPSLRNQATTQPQNNILPPSLFNQHDQSSKQLSIPQSFLPNIGFSLQDKKEVFSPIPHKSRHEIRMNNQPKIDSKHLINQSRPRVSVEGAKKAQSRVYNNSDGSKDIKIDFDFQIDI